MASSRSPATRALYRSQWRAFSAWCRQHRHRVFPADPAAAAAAAIGAVHRAAEIGDPTATPGVREVIRGLARDCAAPQRQAQGMTADECAALISRSTYPRKLPSGRMETARAALRRGRVDAAIAGLLFQGALRRSEAAALKWGDIEETEAGILVHVRRSKTNAEGAQVDVRFLKNGPAAAVLALRPPGAAPDQPVLGGINGASVGRRFAAAARAAGLEGNYTAHSGRVGLACELVRRGASTTAVQQAGGWKTARMVARYSAGVAAEDGAGGILRPTFGAWRPQMTPKDPREE